MTRRFISGTMAAAEATCLARVDVVAAYPITPQTHIVEVLSRFVYDGRLKAELVPVESEHSAMSATVGAAMVGSRAFTASSSQGLALMHEVLPYAAGLRLPLVMAVANRAVASPVTIFTDHQDSLMQRDTGFLQFHCETCQEILDCILLAYRVAEHENVLLPVMICFDGFFLSHINEPVEIPAQGVVDEFLPKKKFQPFHLDSHLETRGTNPANEGSAEDRIPRVKKCAPRIHRGFRGCPSFLLGCRLPFPEASSLS